MNYESIFDFLKSDERFIQVYNMCVSMEKSIIGNSYNASLILSRTASELIMKLLINDSDYLFDFYKKNKYCDPIINKRGEYVYIPFSKMIEKSREYNLIQPDIEERYKEIITLANSNVYGDGLANYGFEDSEKAHKHLFFISQHGYNKLNDTHVLLPYENLLSNHDFIEVSPQERENQVGNVRFEEVSKENDLAVATKADAESADNNPSGGQDTGFGSLHQKSLD